MGGHEIFPIPGSEGEDDPGGSGRIGPIHGNPESHGYHQYKGESETARLDEDKAELPKEVEEIYRRVFKLLIFIKLHGRKVFFYNEGGGKELHYYDAYPYRFLVYDEEYEEGTTVNIVIDFGDVEYQIVVVSKPNYSWELARIDGSNLFIFRRRKIRTFNNYGVYETVAANVGLDSGKIQTYQDIEFDHHGEGMPQSGSFKFGWGENGNLYPDIRLWSDEDSRDADLSLVFDGNPDLLDGNNNDPFPSFVIGEIGSVYYLLDDIVYILDSLEEGPPPLSKLYSAKNIATKN